MYHPRAIEGREPVEQEYLELWNMGEAVVDLSGWQVDRGVRFAFPPSTMLAPGGYLVVASDPGALALENDVRVLGPWEGRLSNGGETVRLVDADGAEVDRLRYADEGDWAERRSVTVGGQLGWAWQAGHDGEGYSLERRHGALPSSHGRNWGASLGVGGTPGRVNGIASEAVPPLIDEVRHYPAVPSFQDQVTVWADVISLGESVTAEVRYRVSREAAGAFRVAPMTRLASGVYAATLPPQPEGTVVEFYVRAENPMGSRTWPAPSDAMGTQGANALYQVDEETVAGDQPYYRLILPVAEDLRFRPERFPSGSNARMNATLIVSRGEETTIRYQAGLRRRGNGSRNRNPRSFRLSLPSDVPWRGWTDLNLVAQYSYLQVLGMHLCQDAYLPAPDALFVQLRINGTNYANDGNRPHVHFGSYAHIQPLNGTFAEEAFPDDPDGDLYKKVSANPQRDRKRWGVHFEDQIVYQNPNWYVTDRWTKETNGAANDWARFQAFIVRMNEAPIEGYHDSVGEVIDVEQWVRWFALMALMNNRETNLSNGIDDDYSIYVGRSDPRVTLLPHDLDTIFGRGDTTTQPEATIFQAIDASFGTGDARVPQLERFFQDPEIRPLYFQALHELMAHVLAPERFDVLVDSLLDHVSGDERDRIKRFNQQRLAHVRTVIDAPLEVVEPPSVVVTPTVALQGTLSPRRAVTVHVNGREAIFDRGQGRWTISALPLAVGRNPLTIIARDVAGAEVDRIRLMIDRLGEALTTVGGVLEEETTFTKIQSPITIEGDLDVPVGRTLRLEEGVVLRFDAGAQLRVSGRLEVVGTEAESVVLTAEPGAAWKGIALVDGAQASLAHVRWESLEPDAFALHLEDASIEGHHLDFSDHPGTAVRLIRSSANIAHSRFRQERGAVSIQSTGGFLLGKGLHISDSLLGAVFVRGRPEGRSERLDLESNVFASVDTALEVEGAFRVVDCWFESVGKAMLLHDAEVLAANCRFREVDQVFVRVGNARVMLEQSAAASVGQVFAGNPEGVWSVQVANSIFADTSRLVPDLVAEGSFIQWTHNYVSALLETTVQGKPGLRIDNSVVGTNPIWDEELRLRVDAPGWRQGTHGQALGPLSLESGVIFGVPAPETKRRDAFLAVTGSGWEQAEYRLDGGDWVSLTLPRIPEAGTFREALVLLTGLNQGEHVFDLRLGEGDAITTARWFVNPFAPEVALNEIAAINTTHPFGEAFPDWVELRNLTEQAVSLEGYALRSLDNEEEDPMPLDDFMIGPNGLVVVPLMAQEPSGLALDRDGEGIALIDPAGRQVDAIRFGAQIAGHTLGRLPSDPGSWGLCEPSPEQSNRPAVLGSVQGLRFNEWNAASGLAYRQDYIELINVGALPIALDGVWLTDDPARLPDRFAFPSHAFIPVGGYVVVDEDALGFGLDAWFERVEMLGHSGATVVDVLRGQAQPPGMTVGRVPDGEGAWGPLEVGSPGRANGEREASERLRALMEHVRVTEVMFHPVEGGSEWLEVHHRGQEPIALEGVRFGEGLEFVFPSVVLAPDERAVLVGDIAAFQAQYGEGVRVLGEFEGRLDNAGDRLTWQLPLPEDHRWLALEYAPEWYPEARGQGNTLVLREEDVTLAEMLEMWRVGDLPGGTPGLPEKPVITSVRESTTIIQDDFVYQLEATNGGRFIEAAPLPPGLSLDSATGSISGSVIIPGTYEVTLRAGNEVGIHEAVWTLVVGASGPAAGLRWESFPESVTQLEDFDLGVSARDAEGRLVPDFDGAVDVRADIGRGAGPAVVISEIRDWGTDGLTLYKGDPEVNTEGWRLFLNAAADRNAAAIHGIHGVPGRVLSLPDHFTYWEVREDALGFNLQWSDDDPSERVGGQKGWALLANAENEAVDFVAWGYEESMLERLSVVDEQGHRITGLAWEGEGVPHPGPLRFTLARRGAYDSDRVMDWQWMDPAAVPVFEGMVERREAYELGELLVEAFFEGGRWSQAFIGTTFGARVYLQARERTRGFETEERVMEILPLAAPELPSTSAVTVVQGRPSPLLGLDSYLAEGYRVGDTDVGGVGLVWENHRLTLTIAPSGTFVIPVIAHNGLGESVSLVEVTSLGDSDGDGMDDGWEQTMNLNSEDAGDAQVDMDGDGVENLSEYLAGTDPRRAEDFPSLGGLELLSGLVRLQWRAPAGNVYTLEVGEPKRGGMEWRVAHDGWLIGFGGGEVSYAIPIDPSASDGRLLRVRVW